MLDICLWLVWSQKAQVMDSYLVFSRSDMVNGVCLGPIANNRHEDIMRSSVRRCIYMTARKPLHAANDAVSPFSWRTLWLVVLACGVRSRASINTNSELISRITPSSGLLKNKIITPALLKIRQMNYRHQYTLRLSDIRAISNQIQLKARI